jgi:hypothetical protein
MEVLYIFARLFGSKMSWCSKLHTGKYESRHTAFVSENDHRSIVVNTAATYSEVSELKPGIKIWLFSLINLVVFLDSSRIFQI